MKVLIIRLGAMGDVCMTVPVAAALQRHCEVHWLIRRAYADIPRLFPHVARRLLPVAPCERRGSRLTDRPGFPACVLADLHAEQYDAVLDFSHWPLAAQLVHGLPDIPHRGITHDPAQDKLLRVNPHHLDLYAPYNDVVPVGSGLHQVDKWRELIRGVLGIDLTLDWKLPALRPPGETLRIFLHPHASKPEKRWPGHAFARVLRELAARRPIACTINSGSRQELPAALGVWLRLATAGIPARIVRLDRSYQRLRNVLADSDLALGCDSGPMHFAALLGVPTVVIYGPYPCTEFGPLWRSVAVSPPQPGMPASRVSPRHVMQGIQHLERRAA